MSHMPRGGKKGREGAGREKGGGTTETGAWRKTWDAFPGPGIVCVSCLRVSVACVPLQSRPIPFDLIQSRANHLS